MIRLTLFLVGTVLVAAGLSWLSDQPGTLLVTWKGYEIETTVFRAVVLLAFVVGFAIFLWSIARQIWMSPAVIGHYFTRRRQQRGLDALSSGMIAIGAGDRALAAQYAVQARKALPNEPLTHLLRAQAAQLAGDRATSRRIFEAMLASPDTEQLGLRGLFLEAERVGEHEAAQQFAERALSLNPKLAWAFDALFDLQCKNSNWQGALETLTIGSRNGLIEKPDANRRRAVLLAAEAQALEEESGDKALELALKAHDLAPELVPAAVIAGRQLAARGQTARVAKVIERTWKRSPHPELALVYAHARPGDSPRDRLDRVKRLARLAPHSNEGPIAIAEAAIEARRWDEARSALAPLLDGRLTQRVCTLMARIEGGQRENAGAVREWLARALHAPRDPAWTADGIVSDTWAPISPVTGALDAFQWRVPVESRSVEDSEKSLAQVEELIALSADKPTSAATPRREVIDIDAAGEGAAETLATERGIRPAPLPADSTGASPHPAPATGDDPAPPGTTERDRTMSRSEGQNGSAAIRLEHAASASTQSAAARPIPPHAVARAVSPESEATAVAGPAPARTKPVAPAVTLFVSPRAPDDPGPEDAEPPQPLHPGLSAQHAKRSG
jgi:HemY protein